MARLTVNNQPVEFKLEADTPLLWALRDAANLTGTKYGCGTGECGACMVIVDGQAMPSCTLSLGEAEGRNVITIEGLSPDRNHPVQQAFVAEQAIQCGFCTPGLVMAAAALLARNASPTEDDIRNGSPISAGAASIPAGAHDRACRAHPARRRGHSRPRPRLPPLPDFEDLKDRR
jgi:isoquinoline 1-oxidoreductase alpha subunit